jgi:RNA polymerase sigma-70 factor (ECF subfamily)
VVFDESKKIDRFAWGIVRRKARQLIGRAGFTNQDREELQQELLAHLLSRLPAFDPEQGHRNKFVTAVVERFVANILRDKRAEKRDHRRVVSINVIVETEEDGPTERASIVGRNEYDARRGIRSRDEHELIDLVNDIDAVLASLPDNLRRMAEGLKTKPQAEVARDMGVPPTTLNSWMRHLRERLEGAGLRDFLNF